MQHWTVTDIDTRQFGRQLSEKRFEFKQRDKEQAIIDLTEYTQEEIEGVINSFGYTLFKSRPNAHNIQELYGKDSDWIIAECLFECG